MEENTKGEPPVPASKSVSCECYEPAILKCAFSYHPLFGLEASPEGIYLLGTPLKGLPLSMSAEGFEH